MERGRLMWGGRAYAGRAERASGRVERMRGLLGRRALGPGAALVIERCGAVHTVGMRFALDLVFLDRAWRVVRVVRGVRAGLPFVWGGWRAARVVESEAGCLDAAALRPGDGLEFVAEGGPEGAGGVR